MERRLLPADDGKTSGDPNDSPGDREDGQVQVSECRVTPRAHPRSPRWLCLRVVGSPESGSNSRIGQLEYELSMNLRALRYPPAIQTAGDASFQE